MDVIFNCPHCDQELSVDASGVGSEIECPECKETIVIPQSATPAPPVQYLLVALTGPLAIAAIAFG